MLDCICDNIQPSTNTKNNNKPDPILEYLEKILNIETIIYEIKTRLEIKMNEQTKINIK